MKTMSCLFLVAAVLVAGYVTPEEAFAHEKIQEKAKEKQISFFGTALCPVECDGACKILMCSVSGAVSYEDAKSKLEIKMNALIEAAKERRFKPTGEIKFEIKIKKTL